MKRFAMVVAGLLAALALAGASAADLVEGKQYTRLRSVQPVDKATLVASARQTRNRIVTVEDHYAAGGIGDAVAEAVGAGGISVSRLAVREIPRSGKPEEMLEKFGIGWKQIVSTVRSL